MESPATWMIPGGREDDGFRIFESDDDSGRVETAAEIEWLVDVALRRFPNVDVGDRSSGKHGGFGEKNVVMDHESGRNFDEPSFRTAVEPLGEYDAPECGKGDEDCADGRSSDRFTGEENCTD